MSNAAQYSAVETLRDGRRIEIRALSPSDRHEFLEAVSRTSSQSLYRRFFAAKRHFTEAERSFFLDIDFVKHVAIVAVMEENGIPMIVGGGRFVVENSSQAEVAFTIVDQYQGLGIGSALMHHIITIAQNAGLKELVAQVLPMNTAMLKVFKQAGPRLSTKREPGAVYVTLDLTPQAKLTETPLNRSVDDA